jgi:hypothetical protein
LNRIYKGKANSVYSRLTSFRPENKSRAAGFFYARKRVISSGFPSQRTGECSSKRGEVREIRIRIQRTPGCSPGAEAAKLIEKKQMVERESRR